MLQFFETGLQTQSTPFRLTGSVQGPHGLQCCRTDRSVFISDLWCGIPGGANGSPRPTRAGVAVSHTEPRSSIWSCRCHTQWRLTGAALELLPLHTRLVRSACLCFFALHSDFTRRKKDPCTYVYMEHNFWASLTCSERHFIPPAPSFCLILAHNHSWTEGPASACAACWAALLNSPHTLTWAPLSAAADHIPITETPAQYLKGTQGPRGSAVSECIYMRTSPLPAPACQRRRGGWSVQSGLFQHNDVSRALFVTRFLPRMFLLHFLAHAALPAPTIPAQRSGSGCNSSGPCRAAIGTQLCLALHRERPRDHRRATPCQALPQLCPTSQPAAWSAGPQAVLLMWAVKNHPLPLQCPTNNDLQQSVL